MSEPLKVKDPSQPIKIALMIFALGAGFCFAAVIIFYLQSILNAIKVCTH